MTLALDGIRGDWQEKCQPEPDNSLHSSGLTTWCHSQLTAEQKGWTYKLSQVAGKDREAVGGGGVDACGGVSHRHLLGHICLWGTPYSCWTKV